MQAVAVASAVGQTVGQGSSSTAADACTFICAEDWTQRLRGSIRKQDRRGHCSIREFVELTNVPAPG
jgi:hypothetical protein